MTTFSMRDRMARAVYAVSVKQFNSRLTWETCTPKYRALVYEEVDAMRDCLTAPPTEAMIAAGIAMLRGTDDGPATGSAAKLDPVHWYRRMVLRVWETMVRAMIEESKPQGKDNA